jgi:hypothetical protein
VRSITVELGWRIVEDRTNVKRVKSSLKGPDRRGVLREEKGETEDVFTVRMLGDKLNQRLDIVFSQRIGKRIRRIMKWEIKRERERGKGELKAA